MADNETVLFPLFEVELNLKKADEPLHKVEVEENSGVHLRCKVNGEAGDQPDFHWMYDGSRLGSKEGIEVETDHQSFVSNLKLNRAVSGIYECGAVRKVDGNLVTKRVKVKTKPAALNQTLFGEVLCGSDRRGYCQHEGTCLFHPTTKVYSCRCQKDYIGPKCEYFATDVHAIGRTKQGQDHYEKSISLIAGLSGVLVIVLIVALLLVYIRKRGQFKMRFRQSKTPPEIITTCAGGENGDAEGKLIGTTSQRRSRLPSASLDERIRLIKALLPARCPHCKRTLGVNSKLDALSKRGLISSRNSTPPMLTYPTSDPSSGWSNDADVVRSVSESRFPIGESRGINYGNSTAGSRQGIELPSIPSQEIQKGSFQGTLLGRTRASLGGPQAISAPVTPSMETKHFHPVAESPKIDCENQSSMENQWLQKSNFVPGIIQEVSVDETGQSQELTALLNTLQDSHQNDRK